MAFAQSALITAKNSPPIHSSIFKQTLNDAAEWSPTEGRGLTTREQVVKHSTLRSFYTFGGTPCSVVSIIGNVLKRLSHLPYSSRLMLVKLSPGIFSIFTKQRSPWITQFGL